MTKEYYNPAVFARADFFWTHVREINSLKA